MKPISEGGLNVIDFDVMNGTLKLRWLQAFLRNKHSVWFSFSSKFFYSLGGIDFLLRCFEPLKLNCKLSSFHSQVLYWKLIYKHNFSPHSCSLWNNKYILIKRKSVFLQDWMDKGVWSIVYIMDGNGNFIGYDDFCEKYNIICTQELYVSLLKAVPAGLVQLIKGALCYLPVII